MAPMEVGTMVGTAALAMGTVVATETAMGTGVAMGTAMVAMALEATMETAAGTGTVTVVVELDPTTAPSTKPPPSLLASPSVFSLSSPSVSGQLSTSAVNAVNNATLVNSVKSTTTTPTRPTERIHTSPERTVYPLRTRTERRPLINTITVVSSARSVWVHWRLDTKADVRLRERTCSPTKTPGTSEEGQGRISRAARGVPGLCLVPSVGDAVGSLAWADHLGWRRAIPSATVLPYSETNKPDLLGLQHPLR